MNYHIKENSIRNIVRAALKEDIGTKDITTDILIGKTKRIKAVLLAKEDCVICGLRVASLVFELVDRNIKFKPIIKEGAFIRKGAIIARLTGRAVSILTAERVALNFLSLLSGMATKTRKFVGALRPYKVRIMDTRKTIPGLRILEKYAVRIAGGFNHRFSLDEMILIKDNHLKVIGGIGKLTGFSRKHKVEIEVKNLKEFKAALRLSPDIVMLDNMSIKDIRQAAQIIKRSQVKLEASGGITLKNVRKFAATGVDIISVGELTHSVNSVDISLEVL